MIFFFRNNVILPSWTLILPESWDKSKTDFKGEVDGFKIEEGVGEGRERYLTLTLTPLLSSPLSPP